MYWLFRDLGEVNRPWVSRFAPNISSAVLVHEAGVVNLFIHAHALHYGDCARQKGLAYMLTRKVVLLQKQNPASPLRQQCRSS